MEGDGKTEERGDREGGGGHGKGMDGSDDRYI